MCAAIRKITSSCILLFVLALGYATPADAARLHAFIIADTLDPSIGAGVALDRELMHAEMVRIAYYADLDLCETILEGKDYDPILVLDVIEELKTEPDDVVVYFHCSHGFRTPLMQEPWPALFFGWHQWALRLDSVLKMLRSKPHRFTLVIADVCNNCVELIHAPRLLPMFTVMGSDHYLKSAYQRFYRDKRGWVVVSGAKPGQYAWMDVNSGSFLTQNFLRCFQDCARRGMHDWVSLLQSASQCTLGWCKAIEGLSPQEPLYSVELQ